jgi:hypothetical protein
MLLKEVRLHSSTITQYAERFINDGSPSGFPELHSTSADTTPFGLKPYFHVLSMQSSRVREFGRVGDAPLMAGSLPADAIFVHPDVPRMALEESEGSEVAFTETDILVVPTASGRTVQILSKSPHDYLKLHYPKVLGRMTRELTFPKAIAGPESSSIIEAAIEGGDLPSALHVLSEPYARVLEVKTKQGVEEWGMVYRRAAPVGKRVGDIKILLPCFALFSADRFKVHHPTIIAQILGGFENRGAEYFIEMIVGPIIDSYFMLLRTLGLQAEWNAQNLMLGFSDDFRTVAIVMRDLESVDKDITLMAALGRPSVFESAPYKCIKAGQYNYQIKHSFMFDFKLGECVLRPLFLAAAVGLRMELDEFRCIVRDRVAQHVRKLPSKFFPAGRWYSFDRVLVDQRRNARPYLEHSNPLFRD